MFSRPECLWDGGAIRAMAQSSVWLVFVPLKRGSFLLSSVICLPKDGRRSDGTNITSGFRGF